MRGPGSRGGVSAFVNVVHRCVGTGAPGGCADDRPRSVPAAPDTVFEAVAVTGPWRGVPFRVILPPAGSPGVPGERYAAAVDGAEACAAGPPEPAPAGRAWLGGAVTQPGQYEEEEWRIRVRTPGGEERAAPER